MDATPYDSHFEDLERVAIHKARRPAFAPIKILRAASSMRGLPTPCGPGWKGCMTGTLPTARAGKKMRTLLLQALELDPTLTDAYLGIGIYNYFVDTLSSIVKFLSIFIKLPGRKPYRGTAAASALRG